mgnify:CR=1 FL=1
MINMVKLPTNKSSLFLRVAKGHFATSHSHINYYIDVTTQKARLSEAKAVAKELVAAYQHSTIVDTVLCLDGTQVIGTCLANELTKDGFANMNAHQTIYVITPEYTSGSQIILRDNLAPMVRGKHVLILSASITTGYTVQAAIEAVNYYGGPVGHLRHHPRVSGHPGHLHLRPLQPARLRQLRQPRLPHVQGRPAHRRAGEQLRLFGPLNLKFSSLFLPAAQLHGGEFYFISQ